jgi:outer membrane scaffolding protein for murein synthesis (MipA/OmpV family)
MSRSSGSKSCGRIGLCLLACLFCGSPSADNLLTQTPIVYADPGTVGLGFGLRFGDSPYKGIDNVASINNDNSSDLVPLYQYNGKRLFFHGTAAGIRLVNSSGISLDAIANYRFDRLEADADPFFEGLKDREQTVDGGLSISLHQPWGTLNATALTDLLSRHNGEEYSVTYSRAFRAGDLQFRPYASYIHQSADLLDYYYGVDADEATVSRPEYSADSDEFWRVGLNTSYRLTPGWRLHANLAYESVPDSVRDSPLTDKDHLLSGFVGASYQFGNVFDGSDEPYALGKGWSWRINAGYTADETFHQVHRGSLRRSDDVDTYLAGVTLGRLLQDGEKIDFWGRVSLNRRFENGLQDDFFEYVAYVMAMGTGYSPWSDRELFRYGFGFGFSYADRVPMVEQVKQARRGEETNHFLNYLEAQVDFPMRNLFGEGASKDCYVGLTLVHRSGIFGTSDILGNVSGGSDVMTAHLECRR